MRPARVLVVDDEVLYSDTLAKVLRRRGLDVNVAHNAADGLSALGSSAFDVVLLDVKMPGTDGLTALVQLRRDHPGVSVILMTGHPSREEEREAAALGAFAYLLKPHPVQDLVARIEEAVSRSST